MHSNIDIWDLYNQLITLYHEYNESKQFVVHGYFVFIDVRLG